MYPRNAQKDYHPCTLASEASNRPTAARLLAKERPASDKAEMTTLRFDHNDARRKKKDCAFGIVIHARP